MKRARGATFTLHFDNAGHRPHRFFRPAAAQASAHSPIGDAGVIG